MTEALPVVCILLLALFMFLVFYGKLGRLASALLFVVIATVFLASVAESIGQPKPLWSELRGLKKAIVVSALPVYGEAIYLWLIIDGYAKPIAYVMPWSLEAAQQLQNAMRDAAENGTQVLMGIPKTLRPPGLSVPDTYEFHADPQPALPAKDYGQ